MSVKKTLKSTILAPVLLASLALAGPGCGGKRGANHPDGDPVRQAEAEYDVAKDLWLRQNRPRRALEHALEAVELDDENTDAHHLVALIYLRFCEIRERMGTRAADECELKKAEKHLRIALAEREDYREAKNTLALVLIMRKRYADAIRILKPLTDDILYQTPEIAWGNLGWAYLQTGKNDLALEALQRSVAAQPGFCVGWYRLGLAMLRKKDLEGAEDAFTDALTRDPRCEGLQVAYLKRGSVRTKLGMADEAREDFERCVALDQSTKDGKECAAKLANLKYSRRAKWSRSGNTFASTAKRKE